MLSVFIHIPKSAGTSIHDFLEVNLGRKYLHHRGEATRTEYSATGNFACIGGHIWLKHCKNHTSCDPRDKYYFTVIREPIERIKSFYRYTLKNSNHHLHSRVKDLSLHDFVDYCLETEIAEISNLQTKMIFNTQDANEIKYKIKNSCFDVDAIFPLTRMKDFRQFLLQHFHLHDYKINIPQMNVTLEHHNQDQSQPCPKTLEKIESVNELDILLWKKINHVPFIK